MPESWGRRSLLAATAGGAAAAALASVPWPALALDRTTAPAAGGMPAATQPPLPLVNAQWLDQNLGRVKLLDAAWYLNAPGKPSCMTSQPRVCTGTQRHPIRLLTCQCRSLLRRVIHGGPTSPTPAGKGAAEFQARRIPGARFFDLDAIADPSTPAGLQSMLPQPVAFGAAADALGIGRGDTVVVYDHTGERMSVV